LDGESQKTVICPVMKLSLEIGFISMKRQFGASFVSAGAADFVLLMGLG